jgi:lipoyl(octanoyl) transferase
MRLAHLHIPSPISYTHSLRLQNALLDRQFKYKDLIRSLRSINQGHEDPNTNTINPTSSSSPTPPPPPPTLLTFSTFPTYTVGRRHLQTNPISTAQQAYLTQNNNTTTTTTTTAATFHASPRGGLLTYHAPGQLTGYIITDLRLHAITPRCWVRLLEESVIRTCTRLGVPDTTRTSDPGVWTRNRNSDSESEQRKICALGVQVSRGVTSHGIGLNVFDHLIPRAEAERYWFSDEQERSGSYDARTTGYLSWGFSRIVACGLEGKSVTWVMREKAGAEEKESREMAVTAEVGREMMVEVAGVLAEEVVGAINRMRGSGKENVDGVDVISEEQVLMVDDEQWE